jgi:hypothetical protein
VTAQRHRQRVDDQWGGHAPILWLVSQRSG